MDWEAALGALLHQAPQLSDVQASRCLKGELPQSLAASTGLRHLTLCENGLQTLPAGPYLASLEALCLVEEGPMEQLPPALAAATALTSLEVRELRWNLSTDGMAALLSQLGRLRVLQLSYCGLDQLPLEGWAGISALQSLDLRFNNLTAVPAALHQATSLRQLNLSYNPLRPTGQQLGALLSRMPLLEDLDLYSVLLTKLPEHLPAGKLRMLRCDALICTAPRFRQHYIHGLRRLACCCMCLPLNRCNPRRQCRAAVPVRW